VIVAATSPSSPEDVPTLVKEARRDLGRLRFPEARDNALQAIQSEPRNANAHALLGIAYIRLGDLRSGEQELNQALMLDDSLGVAHAGMGIMYWEKASSIAGVAGGASSSEEVQDLYQRAEAEFKEATRLDPHEASAHDGLGGVYYHRKEYPKASKEFQAALKEDPEFVSSYFNLGNVLLQDHQWAGAELSYRRAIGLSSQRAEFHAFLAAALLGQGKANDAQKEAKEAYRLGLAKHWIYDELKKRGWPVASLPPAPTSSEG